jgi:hypothetical protein
MYPLESPSDDTIQSATIRFSDWLDQYGEVSYDHQSFFASTTGRWAKGMYYKHRLLGTAIVGPMILCEAFLPSVRTLFWKPQRFPIADAHYAMGFAFLAGILGEERYYKRAVQFLDVIERTRCPGYVDFCWGYPFDWETRGGTIKCGTPLVTTIPYVYEAFSQVYGIDKSERWLQVMHSIAEHVFRCYRDTKTGSDAATCAYTPAADDNGGVVNASAYRAYLLTKASLDFSQDHYQEVAKRNLNFVLSSQNSDGSWFYSVDGKRDFVDHFHTCFVLKALAKIEKLTGDAGCAGAIERGVDYYVKFLFDEQRLPKPFSKAPRLTVYRRELYDYAECINLATLLRGRFKELDLCAESVLADLFLRWRKPDGSFRARELLYGWDNIPMHRWAQSQVFRSLCFLLHENSGTHPVLAHS